MEEIYQAEALKTKLIIAGIEEIQAHGITDFSLRRVAKVCGASCAAPYRHFKSKEEFVLEIIKYINKQWELLYAQIVGSDYADPYLKLEDVVVATVRFQISNPDFKALLMFQSELMDQEQKKEILKASNKIAELVEEVCLNNGKDDAEIARKQYAVCALLNGTVVSLLSGESDENAPVMQMLRASLRELLV